MADFKNYKFRPSSVGKLMTNGRSKKDPLSETTKSYLSEIFIEEVYGRKKDITSKYTEKGLLVEEDSLDLISKYYQQMLIKNTETLENDFIKGTPDIISDSIEVENGLMGPEGQYMYDTGLIIDAKSSWDIWTFFAADGQNRDYYWQLQSYMWLTKKKHAALAYCLNNAPDYLIVQEKKRQMYNRGLVDMDGTPEFDAMEKDVEKNMIYDDIDQVKRIKVFNFQFDLSAIQELKVRIFECREYLSKLKL